MEGEKLSYPSRRWIILLTYMFVAAMSQFLWINFAAITSTIETEYHVSEMAVGWLAMIFPLVYIPVSIPSGMVIDSKGYKNGVGIGAILIGVFSLVRLIDHSYTYLFIGQLGIAIGQPFILNGVSKMAANWFSSSEREIATGLGTMSFFIGIMLGLLTPPFLVKMFQVSGMLLTVSIIALLSTVIFWLLTREKPKGIEIEESGKIYEFKSDIIRLLKIRDFLILCALVFIGMGAFNGISTWIEKILGEHGVSQINAGLIGGILVIGGIIGSIVIPTISAKIEKRKIFLVVAVLGSVPVFMIFVMTGNLPVLFVSAFYLGFVMLPALPIVLDWAAVLSGKELAGTSASILWMLGQTGGFIIPYFMEIIKLSTGTFYHSMLLLVILYLALLPFVAITKETK